MRKAIIGVAAVGAVVGIGVVSRRMGHKMREHCGQMAARSKDLATPLAERRELAGRM